jgi:lysine-specific demethylase 3
MKFLQKELPHLEMAKIRKFPDRNICQLCDSCQTTIFSGYWMCCVCGKEYCLSCYEEWNESDDSFKETRRCSQRRQHYKEQLVPIYHYTKEEIIRLFDQCNQMILDEDSSDLDGEELPDDDATNQSAESSEVTQPAESSEVTQPAESSEVIQLAESSEVTQPAESSEVTQPAESSVRHRKSRTSKAKTTAVDIEDSVMPVLNQDNGISTLPQDRHNRTPQLHDEHKKIEYAASEMTEETFRDLWKRGYPFVIRGAHKLEEEIWKPNYFIEHYGDKHCTVIDVKENVEYKMDVKTFFKGFEDISSRFVNKFGMCPCLKLKVFFFFFFFYKFFLKLMI